MANTNNSDLYSRDLHQEYMDGLITLDEFDQATGQEVDEWMDARLDEILRAVSYREDDEVVA